jgi:TatD DNase family protein
MELFDTHCHIHFPDYELDPEEVIKDAQKDEVTQLLAVGCTLTDSKLAIQMAARHDNIWATIGLHPHEGVSYVHDHQALQEFRRLATKPKVVAIGETGLDYHYKHSSKEDQQKLFRYQLELAQEHDLPLIFHVREAFDDFLAILDDFKGVRGVVHSFTANTAILDKILAKGLYIGLNGIVTFAKDPELLETAKAIPLQKLLLETDAPFLTPAPFRGTICQPKHVRVTADFLSQLRAEPLERLAAATTHNARELFNLKINLKQG